MNYDLSILIPSIRTYYWQRILDSLSYACQNYNYEVIFVGPFPPPEDIHNLPYVKYIKDWGQPSRCAQIGLLLAEGDMLFFTVDDGRFIRDSLDLAMDFYKANCGYKDVINMRYLEASNSMPLEYWTPGHHGPALRHPGVNLSWKIALHPLLKLQYALDIGGWDCKYEYCNNGMHDFVFRIQKDGGVVYNSPIECCNADQTPNYTVDHAPIESLHWEHDQPLLIDMYKDSNRESYIDINNWKETDPVWLRRFNPEKLPNSYDELYHGIRPSVLQRPMTEDYRLL